MSEDARFEDGAERALRLKALESADLEVISALVQDAVFPGNEMSYRAANRRFAILLNRFRWEDAAPERHGPERVQSVLVIEDVLRVQTTGVRRDADTVLSVLSLGFEAGEDGAGRVEITLAGDGAIGLDVEALEVTLRDVTRPYGAPSGAVPGHPE
ncbi:hypothetical protein AIOL_004756 [Candidatus Rhodobacter oscarellae]|uniref:DUF2948 family protein n=1 Tax=Candidatus Rhodobacter oscarellae TaxID=1675527 RepID=A0A0J9H238_9RHOB|nr:DUF2948 family protein [Candidatus Rhodobacter lobularis]KMW59773.1 hypothetical protein AIOL_004756 [Candidatus Rhodobacter lobularis]